MKCIVIETDCVNEDTLEKETGIERTERENESQKE